MGLSPGSHSMVGIYSRNCPEWIVAEQGVYSHSMILVPLYDSLGPDARSFVISQCEMRLVIAHDEESLTNILNSAPPCLKVIVTIKDVKPRIVEEATSLGLKIVRFVEIEKYGAANLVEEEPPSPSTIATICFSRLSPIKNSPESKPKGVMLSHEVIYISLVFYFLSFSPPEHRVRHQRLHSPAGPLRSEQGGRVVLLPAAGSHHGEVLRARHLHGGGGRRLLLRSGRSSLLSPLKF